MSKSIKRIPVTEASFARNGRRTAGVIAEKRDKKLVKTSAVDALKARKASLVSGGGIGFGNTGFYQGLRNSYAQSNNYSRPFGDMPMYFALMNENNGGLLYWPVTLKEKYEWYRYFQRCFTDPNVLVTRDDGTQVQLHKVKVGDSLINVKGETTKVAEVTSQYHEGLVYRLYVEGNRQNVLEVTEEHPFFVLRKEKIIRHHPRINKEDGKQHRQTELEIVYQPEWVSAKDIQVGDCFIVPKVRKPANLGEEEISIPQARLLGYYLSEGNLNRKESGELCAVTWSFGTHEEDLLEEIRSLCQELGLGTPSTYNYESRETCTSLRLWNKEFATWLLKHGGEKSHTKKLSPEVFHAEEGIVKHLVSCWLNGDGYRNTGDAIGQLSGTTVSSDLCSQIYLMLVRCGFTPAKYEVPVYEYGVVGTSREQTGTGWGLYLPPFCANELIDYTKWKNPVDKYFRHRKYNYEGTLLVPVRKIEKRDYAGLIFNLRTDGKTFDDRTFLVYGLATHNTDPYVGQAVDLHVELPLSKIMLNMPKMKDKKRRERIYKRYDTMCKKLRLFQKLQSVLLEYVVIGNVFIFMEFDEENKCWRRMVILPPEEVNVRRYPCSDHSRVEYRPDRLIQLVAKLKECGNTPENIDNMDTLVGDIDEEEKHILSMMPRDLLRHIFENNTIVMDTDPYSGDGEGKENVGSYVYHLARRRPEYFDLGVSILERILVPMLIREHYKYTQLSLASRNMTPRNKISAPEIDEGALDSLREQVDLSMLDPDFSIVTNYDWSWEQIGAENRLLDLSRENEALESQMFAGLGVTRELLTGDGMYSGGKITVEILNTRFLLMREVLVDMIEENMFKPMADANGDYEDDEEGNRTYFYPKVSFNRLTIRDNQEVFDSLFQLYQKGSLPVSFILEMFNLDADKVTERLGDDLFTVKDAVFNDLVRSVYTDAGRKLVESTDIVERIAATLKGPDGKKLTWTPPAEEGGGGGPGGGESDFSGFGIGDGGEPATIGEGADTGEEVPADATEGETPDVTEESGTEDSTGVDEQTNADEGANEDGEGETYGIIEAFIADVAEGLDKGADKKTILSTLRKKLEGK